MFVFIGWYKRKSFVIMKIEEKTKKLSKFERGSIMSLMINKSYDEANKVWNIKLDGEVDIYTAGSLKDAFMKMLEENKENIKIDAEKLDYIDSTGLGVLIGVLKKLREEEKNIIILNIKPSIKKLLNITGLDKIFVVEG